MKEKEEWWEKIVFKVMPVLCGILMVEAIITIAVLIVKKVIE